MNSYHKALHDAIYPPTFRTKYLYRVPGFKWVYEVVRLPAFIRKASTIPTEGGCDFFLSQCEHNSTWPWRVTASVVKRRKEELADLARHGEWDKHTGLCLEWNKPNEPEQAMALPEPALTLPKIPLGAAGETISIPVHCHGMFEEGTLYVRRCDGELLKVKL
ncbi:hypothetical protein LEM8419_03575 [Neolewinella maritima]|uniref:Uncharacterized protein n=1 Tax=Neolewinella maritima TaxID=1383882 RepID=A0ABN8FEC3_9BACT|nr:hypothetical protein LEM8419_03575 [Neolewinella maritima]